MTIVETSSGTIPQFNLPWIDSPFFTELLAESDLDTATQKFVKHYAEQGYAIVNLEIPDFNELVDEIIRILPQGRDIIKYMDRVQNAWLFNQAVRNLAIAPQILSILKTLYQREPIPFQTLNFWFGTQQKTHSDTIHFNSIPARFMCGVWVAMEDIDKTNGPLYVYPRSHKLPIFDLQDMGLNRGYDDYDSYEKFIAGLVTSFNLEKRQILIKKGQAIIWSANLLHGGSLILDLNRTRYSQVTHYFFSDCLYYLPMRSDGLQKKLHKITNIRTKKIVPQFCNDKLIVKDEGLIDFLTTPRQKIREVSPFVAKVIYHLGIWKKELGIKF